MNKLLICAAALLLTFGAGTATASGQANPSDRPITSSPGGTHGDSDGECEQIGSNMWSCWACEESGDETLCDTWFQTDDGEEFYREPGTRAPRTAPRP